MPTGFNSCGTTAACAARIASTGSAARPLDVVDVERRAQRLRDEGAALGVERAVGDPALDDQTREQSGRRPRREQMDPEPAAGRQPEHRHLRGVAAERGDVLAHPLQRGDGIVQPEVRDVATDRARVEESERAEAVVRGDDHDVLLRREPGAVVAALRRRSEHERTTVEPDHHRVAPRHPRAPTR